jgi:hypothetical protein
MNRTRLALIAVAGTAGMLALAHAQQPPAWARAQPGLWEISGAPGMNGSSKQCVTDISTLTRYEHRGKNCSPKITSNSGSSTVVDYRCGSAGFGHSTVDVITPRSLRIDTQGISNQLPFAYVLQARRVGDCTPPGAAPTH